MQASHETSNVAVSEGNESGAAQFTKDIYCVNCGYNLPQASRRQAPVLSAAWRWNAACGMAD